LNKKDSLAVVKFLLPRVDITGKLRLKDYNLMKKCIVWLGEIAWGMTWDEHKAAAALDIQEQWETEGEILGEDLMLDAPPIFALGGILWFFFKLTRLFPILIITVLKIFASSIMLPS